MLQRARPQLLAASLCLILSASPAAGYDDLSSLELFNGPRTENVSGTRSPRPASQTAENITVVTSKEIEALNAHTLADVLYYVTGVQLEMVRTPGAPVNIEVQGSNYNHVLVLVDGVPINNLADNFPYINMIPIRMVERVEVVKGAASSSWGNALGGVINVVTKEPDQDRPFGGMVSGSFGQRETTDVGVEFTGTEDRFGYYLTAGRLRSDGLAPNNMVEQDSFYAKLTYALRTRGSLTFSTGVTDSDGGMYWQRVPDLGEDFANFETRLLVSRLSAQYQLTDHLAVEAGLLVTDSHVRFEQRLHLQDGSQLSQSMVSEDSRQGANLKLLWLDQLQRVTMGADFEHVKSHVPSPIDYGDFLDSQENRVGVYLSDTISLGRFAITPSARLDHTGSGGDLFSPSFGVTYALTDNSVLRGYTSRGYSLTSLNRFNSTEKVWTTQVGFECGDVPYLWLKGTLFRNDTWDVTVDSQASNGTVLQRQLKQGGEVEARTVPLLNTSLSAGYTFIKATEGEHGPELEGSPRHTAQLGLRYQHPTAFQADLNGRYVKWNLREEGRFGAVLWDLHLRKKLEYSENGSLELSLSVRNLFDDLHYVVRAFENPGRWVEVGVRCNF